MFKEQYLYCVLSLSKNLWSHTWRIQYCAKMFSQASPLIKFGFKKPDFNVFFLKITVNPKAKSPAGKRNH